MFCRYYADHFIVLPKIEEYLKEDSQQAIDKHAAVAIKRLERVRAQNQRDDGF